jgi:putative serine protease PepD
MPRSKTTIAAAFAASALAAGGAGAAAVGLTEGGTTSTVTVAQVPAQQIANVSAQLTVGEIARRSTKSVVEVLSTSIGTSPYPSGGSQSSEAEGTGWVYDTAGHIVTNQHVVDGATSVKVVFADGTSAPAKVVGSDISTDLAVLKVGGDTSKLVPLTLGDSSAVAVGDGVVAIGAPYGLAGTVTSGIVSAVNRELQAPNGAPIEGAIQTDAAINHGNSGGPLFALNGKVIGITSQIESDSGASDGVGFAIPSNTVKSVVSQIVAGGTVQHAFLGVAPQTVPGRGVKIASVQAGSAAAKAGLKLGDVITSLDGARTADASALRAAIDAHRPGGHVTLTVQRAGKTIRVGVTLGSR